MGNPTNHEDAGRVLFLDDSACRHSEFLRVTEDRGVEVHRAWTAAEAIALLEEGRFDQAFLDHDLSEDDVMCQVGSRTNAPTGMDVVDHILKMERPPSRVVVHSCNGPAAIEMHIRLETHPAGIRVSRCPFPFLMQAMRRP